MMYRRLFQGAASEPSFKRSAEIALFCVGRQEQRANKSKRKLAHVCGFLSSLHKKIMRPEQLLPSLCSASKVEGRPSTNSVPEDAELDRSTVEAASLHWTACVPHAGHNRSHDWCLWCRVITSSLTGPS